MFSSIPGNSNGHIPLIETVGDILVPDINQATGLATGNGQIGAFSVLDSPFGGEVRITGRIGEPAEQLRRRSDAVQVPRRGIRPGAVQHVARR